MAHTSDNESVNEIERMSVSHAASDKLSDAADEDVEDLSVSVRFLAALLLCLFYNSLNASSNCLGHATNQEHAAEVSYLPPPYHQRQSPAPLPHPHTSTHDPHTDCSLTAYIDDSVSELKTVMFC